MTDPSPPPRMLSAPLRLTAMTLRGLGPYLHGARLEIKPLTILCGENGSGKSTWIEALRFLKLAAGDNEFPLKVHADANRLTRLDVNHVLLKAVVRGGFIPAGEIKNARLALLGELDASGAEDEDVRESNRDEFGPPGCIGLKIKVVGSEWSQNILSNGVTLPNKPTTAPERLLWEGKIDCGATIELRWALPHKDDAHPNNDAQERDDNLKNGDGLHQWVELRLHDSTKPNDPHVLRFQRSLDRDDGSERYRHIAARAVKETYWTFEASPAFLFDPSFDAKPIPLGTIDIPLDQQWKLKVAADRQEQESLIDRACRNFQLLFQNIIQEVLRGFFPIGPLRKIHSAQTTKASALKERDEEDESDDPEQEQHDEAEQEREEAAKKIRPELRYVEHSGKNTQELYAHWAYNLMRQPAAPYCGEISNEFRREDFKIDRKKGYVDGTVATCVESLPYKLLKLAKADVYQSWEQGSDDAFRRDELALQLLNDVLTGSDKRELFAWQFRDVVPYEFFRIIRASLKESRQGQDKPLKIALSNDEFARVNRLLLEAEFNKQGKRRCLHRTGYLFETFVSFWLERLTKTPLMYGDFSLIAPWPTDEGIVGPIPNGGLVEEEKEWLPRGDWAETGKGYRTPEGGDMLGNASPPTSGYRTGWGVMSTGFHQLAPIVVQAGLLRQNEIMAVENPEAHLHPKLQIKVAEFLMHQANSHKIMLIETHSDLFVRRVLRAIREEQVSPGNVFKQSSVGINFTSLIPDPQGFKHAKIEELKINDQGQIGNWPDGFMDDDLKEANNWLATMERQRSLDDEE